MSKELMKLALEALDGGHYYRAYGYIQEALDKGEEHMTETTGTTNVTLIRENEDGSADYQFNFPPEALEALTRLGILTAIQAGIEDAKRLNPEEEEASDFTPVIKELADEAGFALWGGEKYKPTGAVVDWACEYDDELVKFYHLVKAKYDRQD